MDRILSVGNKIELSKIKKNKDDDAVTYVSHRSGPSVVYSAWKPSRYEVRSESSLT